MVLLKKLKKKVSLENYSMETKKSKSFRFAVTFGNKNLLDLQLPLATKIF